MSCAGGHLSVGPLISACLLGTAVWLNAFEVGRPHLLESSVRERANESFTSAWFIKPSDSGDTNQLVWKLAPIIVHEAIPGSATNQASASSVRTAESLGPLLRVFTAERPATLGNRPARQLAYLWSSDPRASSEPQPRGDALRGVVITVDLEGWPVLTEVLATTSSRVFFVTERLERAAEQEFGAALRHRKFAIERSSRSVPGIVVARVIQDGPMPMGPMLYVTRNQQTVTTVLCRCMPAQLKSIEGPRNYELVMIEWPRDLGLEGMALNDCLRLPGTWPRLFDELDSLEPGGRRTGPTP